MNRFFSPLVTGLTLLVAIIAGNDTATANEYRSIGRNAVRLQAKTRQLANETIHYRHTPNYEALVRDTQGLQRLAAHIRDVAKLEGNLAHLEQDLRDADACFHRLERLFGCTEHAAAYGNGIVRGNTRHVRRLLDDVAEYIHEMQADVDLLRRSLAYRGTSCLTPSIPSYNPGFIAPSSFDRGVYQRPNYRGGSTFGNTFATPPSRHGYGGQGNRGGNGSRGFPTQARSGFGFTIGGGSSQIHIRF